MAIYYFKALNPEGHLESGLIHGANKEQAALKLKDRSLDVQDLSEADQSADPLSGQSEEASARSVAVEDESIGFAIGPVPLKDLQFFFRQLGTMLEAGISPAQSLMTLSKQSTSPRLKAVLLEARNGVIEGRPLSIALEQHKGIFTPLMISMVKVGEQGGLLASQCNDLSDYIQRDIELKNTIKKETAYPKIVLFGSIFIIMAAQMIVASMGKTTTLDSPLNNLSTWFSIAPMIILIVGFVIAYRRSPAVQAWTQRVLYRLPVVGHMLHGFAMAKFGRAFAALYKGGLPIPKAYRLAADATDSESTRERVKPSAALLDEGHSVSEAMIDSGAFSPMVVDMTRTGETTGNLDMMLTKISEYYEEDGKLKAKQLTTLLGILCIVSIGIYVGYVVITFYRGYAGGMTGI
jgi:type II secretory pathway component PulF